MQQQWRVLWEFFIAPILNSAARLMKRAAFVTTNRRLMIPFGMWAIFMAYTVIEAFTAPPYLLPLNFWAFAAGLFFAVIAANPFAWLNGKRLVFGCMAFAMMLGRIVSGAVWGLVLGYVGSADLPPTWALFVITPGTLLMSGMTAIIVLFGIAMGLFIGFVAIPVMLFRLILDFDNLLHVYRYKARGLARYIVRFVYWLRNEPLPQSPPDDSKGARFATPAEIRQLYAPSPQSMAFGHLGAPLFLQTDKHILIMASTRSGKGVTLIIPHLLRYRGSAFVLDPKGENAKATGRCRAALNDKVHYLDPFGISGKPQSRFNPLTRFTPDNMEAESKALAAALFVIGDRERDHWTTAGQQLLAAIILYVYVSTDVPSAQKDLPTVRRILLGALKQALEAMVEIDEANGLLRDLAYSFLQTPEREFGSIVSTVQRQTEILDNPAMIACLAATGQGSEVDFADWHAGTMTVYLCLSAPKFPVFNRWLRLVLTSALDEMTDRLNPPTLPVSFMLDELATLGHLVPYENAVGLAAGYGIQLVSVFQDIAQMRDLYKGRWPSIVGNAGVRALFNLDDYDTAEYWSKFIGASLYETRSTQQDIYGFSRGDTVGEAMRPLIPPDQLMMEFASGQMLVLAQGARPFATERVAYFDDASLNGLWDDPRTVTRPVTRSAPPPPPPPKHPEPPPQPGPPQPPPPLAAATPKPARAEPVFMTPKPAVSRPDNPVRWPEDRTDR